MAYLSNYGISKKAAKSYIDQYLEEYADPDSERYHKMVEAIGREMNFSSLRYHRLDDMVESVGIDASNLCTYCWNGKE